MSYFLHTAKKQTPINRAAALSESSMLYTRHGLSMAALAVLLAGSMMAGDAYAVDGGVVTGGSGEIIRTTPNITDVNQFSQRLITDWRSLDVAADETLNFNQSSASMRALARVNGSTNPTQILGKLKADAGLMIVDPNGVFFGAGSQVNVGSLVVSTADISNENFNADKLQFNRAGNRGASIINEGSITAKEGGLVAFVAPSVRNDGAIIAKGGRVEIAGAQTATLDMDGSGLIDLAVDDATMTNIQNNGLVSGAYIAMTAVQAKNVVDSIVNNSGVIEAQNLVTDMGGEINLTGGDVILAAGSLLDATGANGGGQVSVGGDYQGGGTLEHAKTVTMNKGATINVSATENGNGGQAVLWSDNKTVYDGKILARGGAEGGNGGRVETSSKNELASTGSVDAGAAKGTGGEWLLDPTDITVNAAMASGFSSTLNTGTSVTVQTTAGAGNGDITIASDINKTAGGDATLTFKADRNIAVSNLVDITSTAGKLHTVLNSRANGGADGGIQLSHASIVTNGGDITMGGGANAAGYAIGNAATNGHGIWTDANTGNTTLNAGGGNITLRGQGNGNIADSNGLLLSRTHLLTNGAGNISLTGDTQATALAGSQIRAGVQIKGDTTQNAVRVENGDYTVTGTNGGGAARGQNFGIYSEGKVDSTGSGNIIMHGTGGSGTQGNTGTHIFAQRSQFTSSGTGDIRITGIAGASSSGTSEGVYGMRFTANGGDVIMKGTGANGGNGITGGTVSKLLLTNGSTFTAIGDGGVALSANEGLGGAGNTGDMTIRSINTGNIQLTGNTGVPLETSGNIVIDSVADVTGTIGILSRGGNIHITADGGDVQLGSVKKTAGPDAHLTIDGANNLSVNIGGGITSTANKLHTTINSDVAGTAADSSIYYNVSTLSTNGGNIKIGSGANADGFATGSANGVRLQRGNFINSGGASGSGDIQIRGKTTSVNAVDHGIWSHANITTDGAGSIELTGNSVSQGILGNPATLGSAAMTGNITVTTDRYDTLYSPAAIKTAGTIWFKSLSQGTNINVGSNSALGGLRLTDAALDLMEGGKIIIGDRVNATGNFTYNTDTPVTFTEKLWLLRADSNTGTFTINDQINSTAAGPGALVVVSGGNFVNNAGTTPLNTPAGQSELYLSKKLLNDTVATNTLNGFTYGGAGKHFVKVENTSFDADAPTELVDTLHWDKAITLAVTANDKISTYGDGATLSPTAYSVSGTVAAGDTLGTATLTDNATLSASGNRNAGSWDIMASNLLNGSGGQLANDGYAITYNDGTWDINKAALSVTANNVSGTYGSVVLNGATGFSTTGLVGPETIGSVTLTPSSGYSTSGNVNAVTGGTVAASNATGGTFDVNNYTINYGDGTLNVAKKNVTTPGAGAGSITANDKVYDGNTVATLNTAGATVSGIEAGDITMIDTAGATGTFASKNVANNIAVAVAGITLSGTDAANYNFTQPTGVTADITPASLTITAKDVTTTYSAGNPLNGVTGFTATGLVAGETVGSTTLATNATTSTGGHYNAGSWDIVASNATGGTFSAGNYSINYVTGDLVINKKAVAITGGVTADNKVYDGNTDATLNVTSPTFGGQLSGDLLTVDLSGAMGDFIDKNVGIDKAVLISGATLTGADAGNYTLSGQPSGVTADITARALMVDFAANDKTYDGTTTATSSGSSLTNLVAGETVTAAFGSANFDTKNAGTNKTVTFGGITISGADAGNYSFNTTDTDLADITAKGLFVTADSLTRIYGDANPALTYTTTGLIGGDTLTGSLTTPATINSNVGVYDILQGSLGAGSNYALNYTQGTLTIDPATLQVTAVPVVTPVGTIPSPLPYTSSGFKLSDNASLFTGGLATSATPASPAGLYDITLGTLAAGSNYAINFTGGNLALTINSIPAPPSNGLTLNDSVQRFAPQTTNLFGKFSIPDQLLPNSDGQPYAPQLASNPANADLNMSAANNSPAPLVTGSMDFNSLSPAAGGDASDLNALAPAAGGEGSGSVPENQECVNDFLQNSLSNKCNLENAI